MVPALLDGRKTMAVPNNLRPRFEALSLPSPRRKPVSRATGMLLQPSTPAFAGVTTESEKRMR
jgi:hypothetical protein